MTEAPRRTKWFAHDLSIKDEPLAKSLWDYRLHQDRIVMPWGDGANLESSITTDGRQMPILDLDFPHRIVPSATPGHSHLYIDVPMSKPRWVLLMVALKIAGVIELGFFVWSIRRGGNFVRLPGVQKVAEESVKPSYGWFRRLRGRD